MVQFMKEYDLSLPEWDIPKKNEKKIYEEFGRFVVKAESMSFSLIEMLSYFYFHNGMDKGHAVQIMMNRENHSRIMDVFINSIFYLFESNEDEIDLLKKWKVKTQKIIEFRNSLVHSQWATGWLSMTETWEVAKTFRSNKNRVGKEMVEITKEDITKKLEELDFQMTEISCIFRCLLTYKKPYMEYFEIINNNDYIFKFQEWKDFTHNEYQEALKKNDSDDKE